MVRGERGDAYRVTKVTGGNVAKFRRQVSVIRIELDCLPAWQAHFTPAILYISALLGRLSRASAYPEPGCKAAQALCPQLAVIGFQRDQSEQRMESAGEELHPDRKMGIPTGCGVVRDVSPNQDVERVSGAVGGCPDEPGPRPLAR